MDVAVDLTLRTALALLFAVAAGHKLGDLRRFRATLDAYRLLPASLLSMVASGLPGVEAGVACALVVPRLRAAALLASAALLLVYAAAIGVNLARGRRDIDCGCAGPGVRRPIGEWLVARNVAVAAVALVACVPVASRPLTWVDAITVAGGVAVAAAAWSALGRLHALAPRLPGRHA